MALASVCGFQQNFQKATALPGSANYENLFDDAIKKENTKKRRLFDNSQNETAIFEQIANMNSALRSFEIKHTSNSLGNVKFSDE
jgi:hypothetical protein